LCAPSEFAELAAIHTDKKVLVKSTADRTFVVMLHLPTAGSKYALGAAGGAISLQTFDDLGACARTAVRLSGVADIHFDLTTKVELDEGFGA
jgi:hypothetical protein